MVGFGCFAHDGCPETREIVDGYVAAWSSGDVDKVVELYADKAAFHDGLLGIEARGPAEIAGSLERRFGTGKLHLDVLGIYAQTNTRLPGWEGLPDIGRVIAVSIHYRAVMGDTGTTLESLTTIEFGTRAGHRFDRHPSGLITRERVFHQPDSLANLITEGPS